MSTPYYEDEFVTLYLGDCREVPEWLAAEVLVTDPPYGVKFEQRFGDTRAGRVRKDHPRHIPTKRGAIAGDEDTAARDHVLDLWGDRPAIVFGGWRAPRPASVNNLLIWHKAGAFPGPANAPFYTNHEEIYVIARSVGEFQKSSPPLASVITTTEHRSVASTQIGHPTAKPLGLMEVLIDRCPPGTVADPFAGSGSTLIAAKALGRKAIGVELDEGYCEIAAARLTQDTLFGAMQ